MRASSAVVLACVALSAEADAPAGAGAPEQALVGRSFGKDLRVGDLVSARALPKLKRDADGFMPFVAREFAARLIDDVIAAYAAEHRLEATEAEVKRCIAGLTRPNRDPPTEGEARKQLVSWKVNHALFEQRHGRLMATPGGALAVDGLRDLLEKYEQAKRISFASPRMREAVFSSLDGYAYDLSTIDPELRAFRSGPKCLRAAP